jgi:acyl-CoA reductase-like NAD-dependent aldehyde dehydrogenase
MNGAWCDAIDGKTIDVTTSANGKERANLLRNWFNLIMAHQDDLARLMTAEQGKPLSEAKGEVAHAASFIEWFAEEAKRIYGDTIPDPTGDKRLILIKQPVGVVAAIYPWSVSAAMITHKVGASLAAKVQNMPWTIILKSNSSELAVFEIKHGGSLSFMLTPAIAPVAEMPNRSAGFSRRP